VEQREFSVVRRFCVSNIQQRFHAETVRTSSRSTIHKVPDRKHNFEKTVKRGAILDLLASCEHSVDPRYDIRQPLAELSSKENRLEPLLVPLPAAYSMSSVRLAHHGPKTVAGGAR
jgi:hypothetical protein